ncbi:alpha/beta hydrolase [Oerskovia flava]|uniref:alpha/beta hydrolase n=1 Tax=Oerskovia flava TaxID=2986422 RepID=UPI00223FD5A8|nr:alpha/beta hydrolase [Oerskovia sp. JB1-3-2]
MTTPRARVLSAATVAALLVGGIPAAAGASPPTAPTTAPTAPTAHQVDAPVPEIAWVACDGEGLEAYECADVEVPSDYDRPQGRTTTIALTRLPATGTGEPTGSVLVNFGGPGGPGVETLHLVGEVMFDPEVRENFDVVGFDPRGVGQSDPVTCFRDAERENALLMSLPAIPLTSGEERRTIAGFATIAAGCQLISGDRLATSSTANVARDMDLLRQALGDEELTYVGYSYGTILGATYSALFPDRVRALVLDGTIDPVEWSGKGSSDSIGTRTRQGAGATETFDEFTRLCAEAGSEGCALAALGDPADVVEDVYAALRESPVEVPISEDETVRITYGDVVGLAFQSLYNTAGWQDLALAFAELAVLTGVSGPSMRAQGGDLPIVGDLLRRLGLAEDYPSIGGALASMCMDTHNPLRSWQYPAHADAQDELYPHFGRMRAWVGAQCAPVLVRDTDAYTGPWEQTTQEPVLVIGTRFDPATPYSFTEPYAAHYPDARVLTVEGWGHTTLGASVCADAAIARYLVDGEAPTEATCEQDLVPFGPALRAAESDERAQLRDDVGRLVWQSGPLG